MTYREYLNRDGSMTGKNIPGTRYQTGTPDKPDPFYQPDELIDAKISASEVMDNNEFYAWSKSLPVELVLNHSKYIAAIYEKIAEIKAMNETNESDDYAEYQQMTDQLRHGG